LLCVEGRVGVGVDQAPTFEVDAAEGMEEDKDEDDDDE
jgi:pre-mRNA-splicing helicase BRR2